ncbi:MAG: class I SAM-dependent methyltransferase [Cyclobacteriaceae bacterium]|nr:class I SAM-dependent methyltransferase [Cyclobacteriaceae bacterium]
MTPIVHCPVCDSTGPREKYQVADRHYGNKGLFTYTICVGCQLEFFDPMPSNDELMKFYPEESYYAYSMGMPQKESSWKTLFRKILFLGYRTKDPHFNEPGRLLDIGCGSGWFMYEMREKGWEVMGVEPSHAGAETGRKANLDIHEGDLLSTSYSSDYFDYIRLNHAFEHIPDPAEVLTEIRRILKPGGKVFIGVPNVASFNAKVFRQYWYYLGAPVHTFNYSHRTLPMLAKKLGFKNVRVLFNSNFKGVLGSIQIYLNRNNGRTSEEGFVVNFLPFRIVAGFVSKLMNVAKAGDCIEVIFEK